MEWIYCVVKELFKIELTCNESSVKNIILECVIAFPLI